MRVEATVVDWRTRPNSSWLRIPGPHLSELPWQKSRDREARGDIAPLHKVCHHGLHFTERVNFKTDMDLCPLGKGVSLGRLNPDAHTMGCWDTINCNVLHCQVQWCRKACQAGHCKFSWTKEAKVAKSTSCPKHAMIWACHVWGLPNHHYDVIRNWQTSGRRQTLWWGFLRGSDPLGQPQHLTNTPWWWNGEQIEPKMLQTNTQSSH